MKKTFFLGIISLAVMMSACSEQKKHDNMDSNHDQHQKHQNKEERHHSHSANEYMHQKPVDELIENFESPERDAYQQPEKVLTYFTPVQNNFKSIEFPPKT